VGQAGLEGPDSAFDRRSRAAARSVCADRNGSGDRCGDAADCEWGDGEAEHATGCAASAREEGSGRRSWTEKPARAAPTLDDSVNVRALVTIGMLGALACGGDASSTSGNETTLRAYACKECRVVAESIAYLGHPDDTVAFREDVLPARDSRGRFYAVDRRGSLVYVFGTDGRLMQSFGKAGRGPGEFVGLRAIFVGPGDTLFIPGGAAIHVISPEYAQVREYRNMGGSIDEFSATRLRDGRILNGRANHQFTLIDSAGNVNARVTLKDV